MKIGRPLVVLAYPKVDHEKDYQYFWMPFSLLCIAKALQEENVAEVVIFDGNQQDLDAWERLLDRYVSDAICIGFSIMTGGGQIGHALELAKRVKSRKDVPLVFGGPHVNVLGHQAIQHPLVDYALQGPGQTSMPIFIAALQNQCRMQDVPGLLTSTNGRTTAGVVNPPRAGLLGRYPWDLLDMKSYIRNDTTIASRTLNYISSQGCVYKCRFCYELTYKRKYSYLPSSMLANDILDLQRKYNINGVKFYDADWFVNLKRSVEFCDILIEAKPSIAWAASINPNDVLKARRKHPSFMAKVAKSGCRRLLMGVESGADRVLAEIVEKEVTRSQILDVAAEIADHGILGSYTFIVGFPGETRDEETQTYRLIEDLQALDPSPETRVHLFAPYPGTPLYEVALRHGFNPPRTIHEWSHFDYYDSQTPWTDQSTVQRARQYTRMRMALDKDDESRGSSKTSADRAA